MLSQRKKEIEAGRFSEPFDVLLPGMNVVPVHVVPKPPDDKLRLVVNHSAGPFSINSLIDRQSIAGVKLDGIKTLGDSIRAFRALTVLIPKNNPSFCGNRTLLLLTIKCQCTRFGKSSKLLISTVFSASIGVTILVVTLLKKSGGHLSHLYSGLPFLNGICMLSSAT
jgi:hypothetical protein